MNIHIVGSLAITFNPKYFLSAYNDLNNVLSDPTMCLLILVSLLKEHRYIFAIPIIPRHRNGVGCWNQLSMKTRPSPFPIVNIMTANVPTTHGATTSADMVLYWPSCPGMFWFHRQHSWLINYDPRYQKQTCTTFETTVIFHSVIIDSWKASSATQRIMCHIRVNCVFFFPDKFICIFALRGNKADVKTIR